MRMYEFLLPEEAFVTHFIAKQNGHFAAQKGNPYQHGVPKSRNTPVYPVDITPLHTHKGSNETSHPYDCTRAHSEINIHDAS